jgi:hypothetical protein
MVQQGKLKKELGKEKEKASSAYERSLQAIRDINFEPGQDIRDLSTSMETAGLEMGRKGEERTDATTARLIASMQGDPRAVAAAGQRGIGSALTAEQAAKAAGTNMTLQAEMGMANATEAGRQQETQRDLGLEQLLMGTAGQAYNSAQEGIYGTDAAMTSAIGAAGNVGTQGLLQYGGGGGGGAGTRSTEDPSDAFDPQARLKGLGIDNGYPYSDSVLNTLNPFGFKDGGLIGEGGGMTEGEFDHATNKKAIIDEENGQKEGELTGGEIVFNPEQTADITDMVEQADAEGLLMLLQELFNEPQFQKS